MKLTAVPSNKWNLCAWDREILQALDFWPNIQEKRLESDSNDKGFVKVCAPGYGEIADSRFECQVPKPKGYSSD